MSRFVDILKREPALVRGAVTALAIAAVHLLVVFGVALPADVEGAVSGTIDAVFTVIGLVWIRSGVSPATEPDSTDPH
jgi:uncharacterized membrane protein